ncbi:type VI secretion system-associated protein TagF [Oceanobacter mangrovi]|uniref:type VI secretion system-associated protein TagF n=1 Tax=Oceanobacter mangrovi TaxID=2862510 RepID=UPI001C8D3044|nr:type VI secretion system-associated protein TagF [Oceanobacter mangrovi]
MKQSSNCGLFGKVPQQAEFVSHFLPRELTELWHQWLQASISVSKEQLGDSWLDYYLTSPVWHFALSPGLLSPQAVVGQMMPSVDEVGRYFPVALMQEGRYDPWSAYLNGEQWYHSAESLLLKVLDEDMSYNHWIGLIESLDLPLFTQLTSWQLEIGHTSSRAGLVTPIHDHSHGGLMQALVKGLTERAFGPFGLWWTTGSEHIEPCLMISSQMPDAGQFAAMLDGRWQHWGWPLHLPRDGGR